MDFRQGGRKLGAAVLAFAFACTCTAADAADPGWQEPLDVSPAYLYTNANLAVAENGSFVHSWEEYFDPDYSIKKLYVTELPAAGPAGPVTEIGGLTFFGASLSGNADGDAILAWDENDNLYPDTGLAASVKEDGGSFSAPISLDDGPGRAAWLETATNAAGDAAIVYMHHYDNNHDDVSVVLRPAGGPFSDPMTVSERVNSNYQDFDVALDSDGDAVVAWAAPDGIVRAARGDEDGFSAPVVLSNTLRNSYRAEVAVDGSGDAIVVWSYYPSPTIGGDLFGSVGIRGSGFGPAFEIDKLGLGSAYDVRAAADGRALVAYDGEAGAALLPVDLNDGDRSNPVALGGPGSPLLAMTPGGQALVVSGNEAAWGTASGNFGAFKPIACPAAGAGAYRPVIASATSAATLMHDYGADIPEGYDDRTLIARSDAARPPNPPCSGDDPWSGGTTPTTPRPPVPLVGLLLPDSLEVSRRGRIKVDVATAMAGSLTLSGRVLIGGREHFAGAARTDVAGPQTTTLKLRTTRAVVKAVAEKAATVRLVATLRTATGRSKAKGTATLVRRADRVAR